MKPKPNLVANGMPRERPVRRIRYLGVRPLSRKERSFIVTRNTGTGIKTWMVEVIMAPTWNTAQDATRGSR